MTPLFRYSGARNAYVLRLVGRRYGPVLREERRRPRGSTRRPPPVERRGGQVFQQSGMERRRTRVAA
ncbi:MAG TPA: hypothetical protein VGG08_09530 [Solirubrobacteraceae bacterium]